MRQISCRARLGGYQRRCVFSTKPKTTAITRLLFCKCCHHCYIYASKQQLMFRNKSSTSASSYANSLSESHLNGRSVRLFPACLNMCQSQCLSGCPFVCPSVWLGVSVTDHKFPFTVRASYHR